MEAISDTSDTVQDNMNYFDWFLNVIMIIPPLWCKAMVLSGAIDSKVKFSNYCVF